MNVSRALGSSVAMAASWVWPRVVAVWWPSVFWAVEAVWTGSLATIFARSSPQAEVTRSASSALVGPVPAAKPAWARIAPFIAAPRAWVAAASVASALSRAVLSAAVSGGFSFCSRPSSAVACWRAGARK
jgi:hypothetical protein